MDFVQLFLKFNSKHYSYKDASNIEMSNLGLFLIDDVGCYDSTFKQWAMADKSDIKSKYTWVVSGNATLIEEEAGFIYLSLSLPLEEDEEFVEFKIAKEKFIKILDDWEEKVCKLRPSEVTIKYENDQFVFETKQ